MLKSDIGVAKRLYSAVYRTDDEDARMCQDISDEACRVVPGNFVLNVSAHSLTKLGDAIINPKVTLPWLLSTVGAPGWIAGLLVPIRESGSMLPQLAIGHWMRGFPRRKPAWVLGAILQGAAVLSIAVTAGFLRGLAAGLTVLGLVAGFSLARGICSIASKDVLGKTVPKTRRGRVTGIASSVAGVGTLMVAGVLWWAPDGYRTYAVMLGAGGVLWLLAAAVFGQIEEEAGATEGGSNGLREAIQRLRLLTEDRSFRLFLIVRALLMGTALTAPFIVLLARDHTGATLSFFLIAQGLASMLSGFVWGALADRSSRRVLLASGLGAAGLGGVLVWIGVALPDWFGTPWLLPGAYFILAVLHDGVRLGRKTYVVDMANGEKRSDYVAVGNTVIGVLLLGAGGLAAALQSISTLSAVGVFALFALAAAGLAYRLPEVQ